jgi:hypothetical protein
VDSFTLMPAWIREQITVYGKKLIEFDYSALHPNIAVHLYQGNTNYLTHKNVAEIANIDLKDVKIEHLSFFNKTWNQMMQSPLFSHYSNNEADMLARIYKDKNEHGHKITSRKMFAVEVAVMSDVIRDLNAKGVYVVYVYDALVCEEKDCDLVAETMNRVILEHGVKTTVKLSNCKNDKQITDKSNEVPERIIVPFNKLNSSCRIIEIYQEKLQNGEQLNFIDAMIEFPPCGDLYPDTDRYPDRVLEIYDKSNPTACYLSEQYLLNPIV